MSVCECGCGKPISEQAEAIGWRYVRGHKPKAGGAGMPMGDASRRPPRSSVVRAVGYDSTLALVEQNRAAVYGRKLEIEEEIQTLKDELTQMGAQHAAVRKELEKLERLRAALAPFCTPVPGAEAGDAPVMAEAAAEAEAVTA